MFRANWLLFMLFVVFSSQAKNILVIESYHSGYAWDISYKKGLEEVLGSEHHLIYFEMDTKRLPESEFSLRAAQAWQTYRALSPDLVILGDDNALKLLGPRFRDTDTPVVYLGINANPRIYGVVNATNITGVLERPLIRRSILMLKKILPVRKALVLLDSRETSKVIQRETFYGKEAFSMAGIEIDIKLIQDYSSWQKQILTAKANGYDVVFPALYHTLSDKNGEYVDPEEVITWTSEHTQIPPFGFWDFSVGADKNIGGYIIYGYQEGRLAGEIALDLLAGNGKHVRAETGSQGQFLFSKTQLDKWGIALPEDIRRIAKFLD